MTIPLKSRVFKGKTYTFDMSLPTKSAASAYASAVRGTDLEGRTYTKVIKGTKPREWLVYSRVGTSKARLRLF